VFVSVEREWLAERLAIGASIEAIAREVRRDPSTVSYWARKHGLTSAHASRHAGRGGIGRELLAEVVACDLSIRDMADVFDRSPTTIRHWLRRHQLTSEPGRRRAAIAAADAAGQRELQLRCQHHGTTRYVRRVDGFRCARCEAARVVAWRRKVKRILVEEAGGACVLCGYSRFGGALQFHHVDPAEKSFALSREGVTRSLARARAEAEKCVLLCANCHAEVEGGFVELPLRSDGADIYPA
jgi:transposase-like protein